MEEKVPSKTIIHRYGDEQEVMITSSNIDDYIYDVKQRGVTKLVYEKEQWEALNDFYTANICQLFDPIDTAYSLKSGEIFMGIQHFYGGQSTN